MKAVVTVIGKDSIGILAKVSNICAEADANVIEVSQSIVDQYFAMIMLIDIDRLNIPLEELDKRLNEVTDMKIHVMHEDIFNSMHRI